jgi:hypothetical protein
MTICTQLSAHLNMTQGLMDVLEGKETLETVLIGLTGKNAIAHPCFPSKL